MIHCLACEKDVHPMVDMVAPGKMLNICPGCSSVLGAPPKPEPPKRVLSPTEQIVASGHLASNPQPIVKVVTSGPIDIIAEAKSRLAFLDNELARLVALQRERRKLAAMIAAADAADADELPHAAE